MLTSSAVSVLKGLKTNFIRKYQDTATMVTALASVVQSDSDLETYAFLGELPSVREFIAERKIVGLSDAQYVIRNKTWESTIGFKREDLEDDKIGAQAVRVREMAGNAKQHPMTLLIETLAAGETVNGYDGVPFFYDSHPARGQLTAVQDNLRDGTGVSVTALQTDLATAKMVLKRAKDEGNKPYRQSWGDCVIVCPPELEQAFDQIINPASVEISSTSNILSGRYKLVVAPELSDTNDWYFLHVGGELKPLVLQERTPVEFTAMDVNTVEAMFLRGEALFGTYARYNAGFGFWQDAVKFKNS